MGLALGEGETGAFLGYKLPVLGRVQINARTQAMASKRRTVSNVLNCIVAKEKEIKAQMRTVDISFTLSVIAPWLSQLDRIGPKTAWVVSHRWSLGELRAKQAAARIKNGVVGRSGTNAPMMPSTSGIRPQMNKTWRFNYSEAP